MQWINKRNKSNRKKAHQLLNRFLSKAWDKELNEYVNCGFDSLKRLPQMKSLLYHEQNGYCCYCMRKLDLNEKAKSTIEHVMPHKVESMDIAYYYAHVPNLHKNVRKLLLDRNSIHIHNERPYPHFCAYENLVLSCSGAIYKTEKPEKEFLFQLHECCNNARGRVRILPLFYYRNLDFIYEKDGTLTFAPEYENTVKALRLELNDNLRLFRKAWSSVIRLYKIEDVRKAISDIDLRMAILMDSLLLPHESKRLSNTLYWSLFYEYRWFGYYFSQHTK